MHLRSAVFTGRMMLLWLSLISCGGTSSIDFAVSVVILRIVSSTRKKALCGVCVMQIMSDWSTTYSDWLKAKIWHFNVHDTYVGLSNSAYLWCIDLRSHPAKIIWSCPTRGLLMGRTCLEWWHGFWHRLQISPPARSIIWFTHVMDPVHSSYYDDVLDYFWTLPKDSFAWLKCRGGHAALDFVLTCVSQWK